MEPDFPSDKDRFTDFNEPYFGVDIAYFVPAVELNTDWKLAVKLAILSA